MKVKVKETPEEFKPVKLELTIESKEDIAYLWAATNQSLVDLVNSAGNKDLKRYITNWDNPAGQLWSAIDALAIKHNML